MSDDRVEPIKIISRRIYRAGYEVRTELYSGKPYGSKDMTVRYAYNPKGEWIGRPKWAYQLCVVRGIIPEKSKSHHCVCSIGYCPQERKWYGWSHRAMYGFGIGHKIKKGDCRERLLVGFECKTLADCRKRAIDFAASVS